MKNSALRICGFPTRYVFAILGFFGFFNVYTMRVNLSVAIVAMVNSSMLSIPENSSHEIIECPGFDELKNNGSTTNAQYQKQGNFDWDMRTQSLILGSFYYGYMCTHFLGGVLAERFSAKWLFGGGCLVTALLTLGTPAVAGMGVTALVSLRVVIGFAEGVMLPSCNVLIGRWAPKMERNRFCAVVFAGMASGSVATMSISGLLIDSGFLGGWPSTFYVFGSIGCVWFAFWASLVYDSPALHPRISQEELKYIEELQECHMRKEIGIPWKSICTSVPVWALIVASFGHLYGFHMIITETPTYLANVLHFNIKTNGFLCALPHILHTFCGALAGCAADRLRKHGKLRTTTIRKIFNSVAYFGSGTCLLLIAFSGCRPALIVALLCCAMCINGAIYAGCSVTHLDMSPDYAGTLVGITNTVGSATGFLAPYVVGQLTNSGQTFHNWGSAFITAAVLYFVCGIVYDFCCTAELQPWGTAPVKSVKEREAPALKMAN